MIFLGGSAVFLRSVVFSVMIGSGVPLNCLGIFEGVKRMDKKEAKANPLCWRKGRGKRDRA